MSETFLIRARWVVPVEPAGVVLENHAVAVRDDQIEAVLPAAEIGALLESGNVGGGRRGRRAQ